MKKMLYILIVLVVIVIIVAVLSNKLLIKDLSTPQITSVDSVFLLIYKLKLIYLKQKSYWEQVQTL